MILLSEIFTSTQYGLKHTIGTPITEGKFVDAANDAIDILLTKGNYSSLRRKKIVSYLDDEPDYDIENDLGIEDYKEVDDLRPVDNPYTEWEYRNEKIFAERESRGFKANEYCVEERNGRDILRILDHSSNKSSVVLHTCDSLTAVGTWTVLTSDATNLTLDESRFKEGSGCLNFDIDVSASAFNYAGVELSTAMTAVDISGYQNIGRFRFDLDLQKLTTTQLGYITNAELRVGSSSSDYLAMTATSPVDPGGWMNNWNRVSFNWEDGAETGTPDYENMDYLAVILNYSASMTDATDIRVDEIKLFEPEDLELLYFSGYMVAPTSSSSTFQERFSTTYSGNECLRLPRRYKNMFVNLVLSLLYPQKKKDNDPSYAKFENAFELGWNEMLADGVAILNRDEDEETKVQGNSGVSKMW